MPRTVVLTLVAGGLACVVDFLIALVGFRCTPVPRDFPPFTLLPILTGTMTEVACTVGYTNPSHFAGAFKRKFGGNPSA
jgi:AraC-like DNA-binding protein